MLRGLGRLPGPVPGGELHRQGGLRPRRVPAGHGGPGPENTLLSHDLFEGVFARAGLVTDVELFDEFPSNYLVAAARQHRWARGDWQLLPWILGRARDARGRRDRGAVPGISRWKMVDNLRRTLSAPLSLATLVAAWSLPSVPAGAWTALVLASVHHPRRPAGRSRDCSRGAPGISKRSQVRAVGADAALAATTSGSGSPSWPTRRG